MPGGPQVHYGCADPILPPYSPTFGNHGRRGEGTHAYHHQGGPSHNHEGDSSHHRIIWFAVGGLTALVLFFVPYLMVDIYLNDIGRKISRWNEAMGRMRERENAMGMEARHLERERIALRDESTRLGKERLTLESTITKMEGEKRALDSAIRHSEQERSRLETQKQLLAEERSRLEMEKSSLEDKRRSLERQELTLREERERWEKARDEQTIPKGAFWEVVWPAWDCRAYGKREYWGLLRNIPEGRSEMDACMNMPVEIKGVHIRRPYRCQYVDGSIHGFWMVDWDQPDCKPWHQNFVDKVSFGISPIPIASSPYSTPIPRVARTGGQVSVVLKPRSWALTIREDKTGVCYARPRQ